MTKVNQQDGWLAFYRREWLPLTLIALWTIFWLTIFALTFTDKARTLLGDSQP